MGRSATGNKQIKKTIPPISSYFEIGIILNEVYDCFNMVQRIESSEFILSKMNYFR